MARRSLHSIYTISGYGIVIPLPNALGGESFSAVEEGQWVEDPAAKITFYAKLSNTATPAAVVEIYGSHYASGAGVLLGTFTLTGANDEASGFKSDAYYPYKRAKVTSISGVGALVTVTVGY